MVHVTSRELSGCDTALKQPTQRAHLIYHDRLQKPAEEKRQSALRALAACFRVPLTGQAEPPR